MAATAEPLILASASTARAAMLRASGVEFAVVPSAVDEDVVKRAACRGGESAIRCAAELAAAKARWVSRLYPDALVIGADQILACGEKWFDKPGDLGEAREQLCALRGRSHTLATAACAIRGEAGLWHATSQPTLTMRRLSDGFLDAYIAAEGEALLGSVGAYRLEGSGVQLFSRISGDHFAVLGLPLMELLDFLRKRGVLST